MKTATMSALDITIRLGSNQNYFDDGYVTDLRKHTSSLERIYKETHDSIDEHGKDLNGRCYSLESICILSINKFQLVPVKKEQFVHIYYKKSVDEAEDLFIRAHEETHALQKLRKLKYLFFDMLCNNWGIPWYLLGNNAKESLANNAALYALYKRGIVKL